MKHIFTFSVEKSQTEAADVVMLFMFPPPICRPEDIWQRGPKVKIQIHSHLFLHLHAHGHTHAHTRSQSCVAECSSEENTSKLASFPHGGTASQHEGKK